MIHLKSHYVSVQFLNIFARALDILMNLVPSKTLHRLLIGTENQHSNKDAFRPSRNFLLIELRAWNSGLHCNCNDECFNCLHLFLACVHIVHLDEKTKKKISSANALLSIL